MTLSLLFRLLLSHSQLRDKLSPALLLLADGDTSTVEAVSYLLISNFQFMSGDEYFLSVIPYCVIAY